MTGEYLVVNAGRRWYAAAEALDRHGLLARAVVDGCGTIGLPRLLSLVPDRLRPVGVKRLLARQPAISRDRLVSSTRLGLWFARARGRARGYAEGIRVQAEFLERMDALALSTNWSGLGGVYVHDGASAALVERTKRLGLRLVHEQTIAAGEVMQRLLEEEASRHPGWEAVESLPAHLYEISRAAYRRGWEAADLILCPSEFVRESVQTAGGPVDKCVLLPYGVSPRYALPPRLPRSGPLRVLTVGTVGLRKGSPDVLAAAQALGRDAVFRIVGTIGVSAEAAAKLSADVELTGAVPMTSVADHLAWADVFLLPSVCEGSAGAVFEAMAAGLPIITTPNAGSIVRDGIDGFLVPIQSPQAVVDKLLRLIADPELRVAMGSSAQQAVAENSEELYGQRLAAAVSRQKASRS